MLIRVEVKDFICDYHLQKKIYSNLFFLPIYVRW